MSGTGGVRGTHRGRRRGRRDGVRGVCAVEVEPGAAPAVRFEHGGGVHEVSCRMLVGADGRTSAVRRRLGIELHETVARTMAGGLLVDGLHDWPTDQISLGTEGDLEYFVFPRDGGRVQLYLLHDIAQRGRFAGLARQAAFLAPGTSTASPAARCSTA